MNEKEMMSAIYEYVYLNDSRENATYVFTNAEEKRFARAILKCYRRIDKLARPNFNEEVFLKIYGE